MRVELNTYRAVDGIKHFAGELIGLVEGNIVLKTDEGREGRLPAQGSGRGAPADRI